MTDCGFPRPLWNNETLGYLLTCSERFPFLPRILTLYFPEKQISFPARVAIPRDGFCLLQFELHQFHLIPLHPAVPAGRYRSILSTGLCAAPCPPRSRDLTPLLQAYQRDLVIFFFSYRPSETSLRPDFSIAHTNCSPWKRCS